MGGCSYIRHLTQVSFLSQILRSETRLLPSEFNSYQTFAAVVWWWLVRTAEEQQQKRPATTLKNVLKLCRRVSDVQYIQFVTELNKLLTMLRSYKS